MSSREAYLKPEGCFYEIDIYERDETKRTKVDDITVKLIPEFRLIKLERTNVLSISAIVDVDGDSGSPINEADVSTRNIAPLSIDLLEELLNFNVVPIHFGQLIPQSRQLVLVTLHLLRVRALRPLLQSKRFLKLFLWPHCRS